MRSERITFRCDPQLYGVLPAPVPAGSVLPKWFKKIEPIDRAAASVSDTGVTIKRCMPFLDALSTGYLLLLPADVRLEVNATGNSVTSNSQFPHEVIGSHKGYQYKGAPEAGRIAMKFLHYWTIKTPPGWSSLFVPVLNRTNEMFDSYAGIVDTDIYESPVNIPFFMKKFGGVYSFERGTPICQVIPFKRASFKVDVRASTAAELKAGTNELLNLKSMLGWYRKYVRAPR
jgi:hypothetical protein